MSVQTYDPGLVKVLFGVIPVDGFAAGSMVKVSHQGDGTKAQVGSAGEAAFVASRNRSAIVECPLMSTAGVNTALALAYQAGLPLPLVILDVNTGSSHVSPQAMIERIPDADYAADVPVRNWRFVCAKMEEVIAAPP